MSGVRPGFVLSLAEKWGKVKSGVAVGGVTEGREACVLAVWCSRAEFNHLYVMECG